MATLLMPKLKILCFGRFYDEIPGGMQKHIEHLFANLRDHVEFVHLVPSRDATRAEFTLHGFPVIRTPSLNLDGSLAISPSLISTALKLHRQYHFDLIHLHFPDPMSHLASLALPARIPRIISWHADVIRQKTLLRFYRPLLRHAVRTASAITVATPAHIDSSPILSQFTNQTPIHIIPYGFDLTHFLTPHHKTTEIVRQFPGKRIFALGRHVYYKGFGVLIKALHQLEPSTQLLIGGTGPLSETWKMLAKTEGLADRIHFLGLINDEDLPAYYQACDVFCLPAISQAEAFGIVQVEAMACAKPVVSTRLNNGVDFVNQHSVTGLTVPPSDIAALAQALNQLLTDPSLREKLGQQARERAVNEFSLTAMGQKTLQLYEQITSQTKQYIKLS
jgi:rhamnosyl/mannosyltransferase